MKSSAMLSDDRTKNVKVRGVDSLVGPFLTDSTAFHWFFELLPPETIDLNSSLAKDETFHEQEIQGTIKLHPI